MREADLAEIAIDLKLRIIAGGERAIGPGKADLLDGIVETGSISAAAKRMGMSYSRAWQLVDTMNRAFRTQIVAAARGGAGGGGAEVTVAGREILRRYRAMQVEVMDLAQQHAAKMAVWVD